MKLYSKILGIGLFNYTVLDIVTTYIGLTQTDAYESNPIAREIIKEFGLVAGMIMSKVIATVVILMLFYVVLARYEGSMITVIRYYVATVLFVIGTYVALTNTLVIL